MFVIITVVGAFSAFIFFAHAFDALEQVRG
jgi:hypothetical protein